MLVAVGTILLVSDSNTMAIAGLVLALNIPTSVPANLGTVFTARMSNSVPMLTLTFSSIAWGVAVIVIAAADGGLVAFAFAMAATRLASHLLTVFFASRLISVRRPDWQRMRRLTVVGAPLAVGGALAVAYGNVDQFLVFTLSSSEDAGFYGATTKVLESWLFIPGSLLVTLAPVFAASWPRDRGRVFRATRMAVEYLSIGSLGLLAFVLVTADPLTTALFTDEFAPAAPGLAVLAGAFVFISYGFLTDNLLIVLDLQVKLLYIALAGLVVNVGANLLLIPAYGFMGAAWTTLGTELLVELLAAVVIFRAMEIRRVSLGRLPNIVLAATLLAAALVALRQLDVALAGLCVAAAIAYPALLFGLRAVKLTEITSILPGRRTPAV
jgi:O-antigen/teichoic acid export membrane protein